MPFATRDDVELYWEQHGDQGEPLLCIMGLAGELHFWEFQTAEFAKSYRTVVFDNRGMGRSGKPKGPYSIDVMAADALAVLDAAGHRRAHVLGISMGGMIAQELALSHPDRVGALVLACTLARPGREVERFATDGAVAAGAPSPLSMLREGANVDLHHADAQQVFKFLTSLVLSPAFVEREKPWLRAMLQRTLDSGVTMQHIASQVAAVLKHDASKRLPSLKAPTLVFTGDADQLVPPHHSDELHRLIPGATLRKLAGGTHGFNVERPDEFNAVVLDWLAQHPL